MKNLKLIPLLLLLLLLGSKNRYWKICFSCEIIIDFVLFRLCFALFLFLLKIAGNHSKMLNSLEYIYNNCFVFSYHILTELLSQFFFWLVRSILSSELQHRNWNYLKNEKKTENFETDNGCFMQRKRTVFRTSQTISEWMIPTHVFECGIWKENFIWNEMEWNEYKNCFVQ